MNVSQFISHAIFVKMYIKKYKWHHIAKPTKCMLTFFNAILFNIIVIEYFRMTSFIGFVIIVENIIYVLRKCFIFCCRCRWPSGLHRVNFTVNEGNSSVKLVISHFQWKILNRFKHFVLFFMVLRLKSWR